MGIYLVHFITIHGLPDLISMCHSFIISPHTCLALHNITLLVFHSYQLISLLQPSFIFRYVCTGTTPYRQHITVNIIRVAWLWKYPIIQFTDGSLAGLSFVFILFTLFFNPAASNDNAFWQYVTWLRLVKFSFIRVISLIIKSNL